MAEIILGAGHQKDITSLLAVVEKEICYIDGVPRKISAHADRINIVAERDEFEDVFRTITLRVQDDGKLGPPLKKFAQQFPDSVTHKEDSGWHVIDCNFTAETKEEAIQQIFSTLATHIQLPEVWRVQGDKFRAEPVSMETLFQAIVQYKASDLHLAAGEAPVFRIDNQTRHSELLPPLSSIQLTNLLKEITTDYEWEEFSKTKQTSFCFHQVGIGYARVSAFIQSGVPHITFRFLPETIPSFEKLNIPTKTMEQLSNLHRGLLLVAGMTGSGKTTTCAAIVDWINSHRACHILSIENPIEYVHRNKKAIISQRSLGKDVNNFYDAVIGALRQDPDVIVIGEMRDPDTIRSAINAAATGHLVISTLHSNTAPEVVNRIVSFFDPIERDLVRLQLRDCLACIICQRLVPQIGGGRIPILELMFNDIKPIRDGIIAGDTDSIRVGIQQTISHSFLFEEYLTRLVKEKKVDLEIAQQYASEPTIFNQMYMGTYSVPRVESLKAARDASQRG